MCAGWGDCAAKGAPATSAQAEGLGSGGTILGSGTKIAAEVDEIVDRVVDSQEALNLPG